MPALKNSDWETETVAFRQVVSNPGTNATWGFSGTRFATSLWKTQFSAVVAVHCALGYATCQWASTGVCESVERGTNPEHFLQLAFLCLCCDKVF
jgi:hypothetical protein